MEPDQKNASRYWRGQTRGKEVKHALCCFFLLTVVAWAQSTAPKPQDNKLRGEMLVSTAWLAEHLYDKGLVVLCIVDDADTFKRSHIPSARVISVGEIAVTRDGIPNELPEMSQLKKIFERAGVTNHSHIVLYGDRSGLLAARTYFTLDYLGLADHAALLDGGMEKWVREGRKVENGENSATKSDLRVKTKEQILVNDRAMQKISAHASQKKFAVVDARPYEEYTGEKLSDDVPEAGHIPGANSVYWRELIESTENPVLKPEKELRALFETAGVVAGTPVVTYCRSGVQSSFDYFVAKYLGYEVKMYDASFMAWVKAGLPVEKSK
jgi:thiosulfate/3-mercaptopyruvate sulfurtransferase